MYLGPFQVDWDSEKECFHTFAMETSEFYSMRKDYISTDEKSQVWTSQKITYHKKYLKTDEQENGLQYV